MKTDRIRQTARQLLGEFGKRNVAKLCGCPKCKRFGTLVRLPTNFKCADLICDFCGYLAQVKTTRVKRVREIPDSILGAAWGPQEARMKSGIYFPLYLVLVDTEGKRSIFYLASDLQEPKMFVPRRPLSPRARRAGWQGFSYNLCSVKDRFVQLH